MNNRTSSTRFTFQPDAAGRRRVSMLRPAAWLLLALFCVSAPASAQIVRPDGAAQPRAERADAVVAAATDTGARFTAASGEVVEMRLEVFSSAGERVFDSDFRRGSVLEWVVVGDAATGWQVAPPDDEYLCVLTLRDLSGRLRQRRGIASLSAGRLTLQPTGAGAAALSAAQDEAASGRRPQLVGKGDEEDDALTVSAGDASSLTVTAHDGRDGQLTSTTGALTFRTGDLFAGKDSERMRITPEGRVGIGTDNPQATLDVAGSLRVSKGVEFPDGTVLTSAAAAPARRAGKGGPQLATGTGTLNRLAKWAETGGAGTLTDSVVAESGGNIGIGVASPADLLDIVGPPNASGRTGVHVQTTTTTGNATFYFENNRGGFATYGGLLTGGSANASTFFGVTRADRTFLIADGASSLGLGIGTLTAQPVLFGTTNAERMRITSAGNVGVGVTAPTVKLDVAGDIKASGSLTGATGSVTGNLTVDTTTLHVDAANNRVGIGTTTPIHPLDVVGQINTSTDYRIGEAIMLHNRGVDSVSVGAGAGFANTGSNNAFVGAAAGVFTSGSNNAFVGYWAGVINTTGNQNSFFGSNAGKSNMTGSYNSFFGSSAGAANTTALNNSFFGVNAGAANTTGSSNSFFGGNAGTANTTANSNSFFGSYAGAANTTGTLNTFVGAQTGLNNTTGSNNSFFGYAAGHANLDGSLNTFFGSSAGHSNSTASNNSFFGYRAGNATTTGNDNSFFGSLAGDEHTTGARNAFFGYLAGQSNTTASDNSIFGAWAGQDNETGSDNAFFGAFTGGNNIDGVENSFFGKSAGAGNTSGDRNTFVGRNAGASNTTEDDNTFVGANSNIGVVGITNATAIGANAVVTQSDSLVLGSGVNVGIGTSAPDEKLHVRGNIYISGAVGHDNGLILKSPNGATCAKLTINNAGALVTTIIPCP